MQRNHFKNCRGQRIRVFSGTDVLCWPTSGPSRVVIGKRWTSLAKELRKARTIRCCFSTGRSYIAG